MREFKPLKEGMGRLLFLNSEEFPISIPVKYTQFDQAYKIAAVKGYNIDSLTNVTLVIKNNSSTSLRSETLSLYGELSLDNTKRSTFNVLRKEYDIIDGKNGLTSQLIESLPHGREQIRDINTSLAQRIMNSSNEGFVVLNVSNNTHVEPIKFNYSEGLIKFKLNPNSNFKSLLQYTNKATLIVSSEKDVEGPFLFTGVIKSTKTRRIETINAKLKDTFYLKPLSMEYGKQSSWERIQLSKEPKLGIIDLVQSLGYKMKYWISITRIQLFIFILLPLLIGSIIYLPRGSNLDLKILFLEIIALLVFQSAANMFNDYFDHKSESDEYAVLQSKLNAGSRLLQLGVITASQLKTYSIILVIVGVILGFYINMITIGNDVLIIGLLGGLMLLSYNLPPINLSYRWYGDIVFSLFMFPIVIIGSNFTQAQNYDDVFELLLIGIGMSSLIISVLFIGNMLSVDAEKAAEKISFTVKFGLYNTIRFIHFLIILFYIIQITIIATLNTLFILPLIASIPFVQMALKDLDKETTYLTSLGSSYKTLSRGFIIYYSLFFSILVIL